jgi:carboxyl-terminal processing protease
MLKRETRTSPRRLGSIWQVLLAGIIALLIVFPFASSPNAVPTHAAGADSVVASTTTPEGRLAVFDDVWQTVYDRYYDAKFHGVDWWGQRPLLRNLAADAHGPRELYSVIHRLLASLKDAHTRAYSPEEKFDWQHPRFVTPGLSLRDVQGELTVVGVEPGSSAQRVGIRPGDLIETIDGQPARSVLEQKLREQAGSSTPQAARLFALAALTDGPPETAVALEWKAEDDKVHRASLRRERHERSFALRIQYHPHVAVVALDAFTHSLAMEFARAMNGKLGKARGLVLDLRNNGGGDAEVMAEIASSLLPRATDLGRFIDRHGNVSLKLETGSVPLLSAQRVKPLRVPTVILTSERTSSAAEILISALKQSGDTTVLGSQTCGCVLAVRTRHALPDGGELDVSELDYQTALGVRLEGVGITPDEIFTITRSDIYSGRDRMMESAIASLRGQR